MPKRRGASALILVLLLAASAARAGAQPAPRGPAGAPALALVPAWTVNLPASPSAPPAFDENDAFVAMTDGQVAAVGLEAGEVKWTAAASPAAVAAGGGLVFLAGGDEIEARAADTGAPRWRFSAGGPLAGALYWEGGWLLASTRKGEVLMLRASDGAELWRQALDAPAPAGASMTGDRLYLLAGDLVLARRLADGGPVWERRLGGRATTLRALDDRLFVGSDDKFLYCLDAADGDERWRWRTGGEVAGTPAVDEKNVYFVSLDNVLRALDRGNGHQRWMQPLGFRPLAGPLPIDGLLLVPGLSPELALFRSGTGAPAGVIPASADPAAVPHLVRCEPSGDASSPSLVVVGRTGLIERLAPPPPPLEAKPVPGLPAYLTGDGKR